MNLNDKIESLESAIDTIQATIKSINEDLNPKEAEEFDESQLEAIDNTSNKAKAGSAQ